MIVSYIAKHFFKPCLNIETVIHFNFSDLLLFNRKETYFLLGLGGLESYFHKLQEITKLKEELIQLESYEEHGNFIPVSTETDIVDNNNHLTIAESPENIMFPSSPNTIVRTEEIRDVPNTEGENLFEVITTAPEIVVTTENRALHSENFEDNFTAVSQERNYFATDRTTNTSDHTDSIHSSINFISSTLNSTQAVAVTSSEAPEIKETVKMNLLESVIDKPRHKKTLSNLPMETETLLTPPLEIHSILSKNQGKPLKIVHRDDNEFAQALPLVAAAMELETGKFKLFSLTFINVKEESQDIQPGTCH
jgi:hypothetical protein